MEGQAKKTFWAEVADAVEDITNMADNATELMTAEFDRLNEQNKKLQRSVQVKEPERHPEGPQAQSSDIVRLEDENQKLRERLNEQNRKLQQSVQVQESERHSEGPQAQSSDIVRLEDENQKLRERLRYLKNRVDEEETLRMDTIPRMTPFFPDWAAKVSSRVSSGVGFRC